ncbi:MAG: DNA-deoxyinosine glycosylase, partial [Firmicutes bacterium]|nr:DNA-deoxyinosine glycosylase [Bacillota bacterium]
MDTKDYKHITHEFEPIFDDKSRILILGTLPSVKSREGNFYYHHPQNRFWKVLAQICNVQPPTTIAEKKAMLLANGIAIWDVVQSCDIIGSSDSSIKNVTPADLSVILKKAPVK